MTTLSGYPARLLVISVLVAVPVRASAQCEPNPCGLGSCTPSGAAYSCNCPPGYGSSGTTCLLQNECIAGIDDCVGLATCLDASTAPSDFVCECPHLGFEGDGRLSGSGCSNINECAGDPCGADDDGSGPFGNGCTERALGAWTQPGYECSCAAGYVSDGQSCVLPNDCTRGAADCLAIAVCSAPTTAAGDFVCTCPSGQMGDGRASGTGCTDVDECLGAPCASEATCTNVLGSFSCACDDGWIGDGLTCADLDECVDDPCPEGEMCTNQLGAPPLCDCAGGFARDTRGSCRAVCGDGIVAGDEGCDGGGDNDDALPDACRTNCVPAHCGDAVVDTGEVCDPGGGPLELASCAACVGSDAGVGADAGPIDAGGSGEDASVGADAGPVDLGSGDAGCDCRAGAGRGASLDGLLVTLAWTCMVARRRRRR